MSRQLSGAQVENRSSTGIVLDALGGNGHASPFSSASLASAGAPRSPCLT